MRRLILFVLLMFPIFSFSETKDTVRFSIYTESTMDKLKKSLETGDFFNMSSKLQSFVILIAPSKEKKGLERYLLPKEAIIDLLNKVVSNVKGIAKIYEKDKDFLVAIESEDFETPLLIAFGVDDSGLVFKVLIQ